MNRKIILLLMVIGIVASSCYFYNYQPAVPMPTFSPEHTLTLTSIPIKTLDIQPKETSRSEKMQLTITNLYDNQTYDKRLKNDWGYSALVEYRGHTLLFDTGTDGKILLENMQIMQVNPSRIEAMLLSHAHKDHVGGAEVLLQAGILPEIFVLPSFSNTFKTNLASTAVVTETFPGQEILPGIYTTGEMRKNIPEQSLVIHTGQGLVVITGCAHPGIVLILEQAASLFEEPIYLVMGGFHLRDKTPAQIRAILEDFRRLGVKKVAPSHCTGNQAVAMFAAEYGGDFIQSGAGKVFHVGE